MGERFVTHARLADDRGADVRVEEHSITGVPRVWLFCKNAAGKDCAPYLDVAMAITVRDGLEAFIRAHGGEARDGC